MCVHMFTTVVQPVNEICADFSGCSSSDVLGLVSNVWRCCTSREIGPIGCVPLSMFLSVPCVSARCAGVRVTHPHSSIV